MTGDLQQTWAANDGRVIPGGCDSCEAEQRFSTDAHGIMHLTVAHDSWCPVLRRMRGAR